MSRHIRRYIHTPGFIGLLSGLILMAVAFALTYTTVLASNDILSGTLFIMTLIGTMMIAGYLMKNRTSYPYATSGFGLLYFYASMQLISGLNIIHPSLFIVIGALLAATAFSLNVNFFDHTKSKLRKKLFIASAGLVAWYAFCAIVGLFIIRIVSTALIS